MLSIPELVRFLVFVVFLVFFLLVCPVFLYWIRRNSRELLSKRPSFLEHHARRHVAMLEPCEHVVDRRQGLELDVRLDLALDRETQGFREVLSVSDERAAYADAGGDHVE